MKIRKLFNVEAAQHVVRNATSYRCSHSVHNHGAIVEIFLTSDKLDNGQMIVDFGLLKTNVKAFIDSFDHCMTFWNQDNSQYINDMKKWNDRWIELPINPTAEALALYMLYMINKIIKATEFNNGEGEVVCSDVIYHETTTGYAHATLSDLHLLPKNLSTTFSQGVRREWPSDLNHFITEFGTVHPDKLYFINPKINQQVK